MQELRSGIRQVGAGPAGKDLWTQPSVWFIPSAGMGIRISGESSLAAFVTP